MALFKSKSQMSKMSERSGFDIFKLGDQIYFFKPKNATNQVVISAHGGHAVFTKTNQFTVPTDTILRFFG